MLGRNPLPKYDAGQSPIRANDLNKLAAEVKRLGQVKASPPLQVMSNATGVHFFLAGGPNSFGFAQLITQVNQNGSGTAWPYKVDSGGNWALNNGDDSNKITVFAPPLISNGQYYPAGSNVGVVYVDTWKRWIIIESSCGGC